MLQEFHLDTQKMPLGKLNSTQVHDALHVLQDISDLIEKKVSSGQLVDASNHFYTVIHV